MMGPDTGREMCLESLSNYRLRYLGFSTVHDYTRYFQTCPDLLGPKGDLKDVQRPWVLETLKEYVPKGQAVIDMGGSACELASCFMNDYVVTVIDPYDGTGNGPTGMAHLQKRFPKLRFIRDVLNSKTTVFGKHAAVVSTSVIEHIPPDLIYDTALGIDNALAVGGLSMHAIDFTVRGEGSIKTRTDEILRAWFRSYSIAAERLDELRAAMLSDHGTYFLSPLMYQQWRKQRTYEEYPWRQVGTVNVVLEKTSDRDHSRD